MKNKTLASIDIGTNTFRLLVAKVHRDYKTNNYSIEELYSDRLITRLGSGISANGILDNDSITRGIDALKSFSKAILSFDVHHVSAVATSALRNARNADEFLKLAKQCAGIDIRTISGEDEARLTAKGILIDITAHGSSLLVDIGGGSTELILSEKNEVPFIKSFDLGVVYLTDRYIKTDPPSKNELLLLEENILVKIKEITNTFNGHINNNTSLIGTAGTITTLAAISQNLKSFSHEKVHKHKLTVAKVSELYSDLSTVTSVERARYIPFESARLDIIVPGTLILLRLMEALGFNELTVSNYGLREGIILELYKRICPI